MRELRQGPAGGLERSAQPKQSKTPYLDALSTDLTEVAEAGKLDPIIGRHKEIERVIQILSRRTKNNPALIGEPGVGKTAIAEGLGAAHHRGRRARLDQGQARRHARYGRAGGRHQVSRPVRRAPQARDRRDQRSALYPVHRRVPYADRRRRRRGHAGRGQYPQAGPGARRAPDDRRDHARRVPQVHRARRGAGAALPAGDGRRADDRGYDRDPARHQERATKISTSCRSPTRRSRPRRIFRRAMFPTGSCPTRRST